LQQFFTIKLIIFLNSKPSIAKTVKCTVINL